MSNILFIFVNILLPVFIQIFAGFFMQKKFKLTISTLTKLQFYIVMPSLLFNQIFKANIERGTVLAVTISTFGIFLILYLISLITAKSLKYSKSITGSFINSVSYYNSGNYTIPLLQLLFNNPLAISVQIIVMVVQNLLMSTFGILTSNAANKSLGRAILDSFKAPMMYSIVTALILRSFGISVWKPVWNSVEIISQALVPMALITLGAQLAETEVNLKSSKVYLSNTLRLVISPLLAWMFATMLNLHGLVAQVIIICAAAPTAVNTVILAIEYDNEPDFSSQAVFSSTVISAVTVSVVIYLATNFI
jgi:predicted permease